ncbi:MAG: hypothetical protein K0R39_2988 [Symbiobacteriaceae bacterium]|jgi:hypothetical protein|nr:hypothetical protein [Symbiobacteriaceae bacterium]
MDQGRVMVDATEGDMRRRAEELMAAGQLTCTFCRRPIADEMFATRRLLFGPRLVLAANLHQACEAGFLADVASRAAGGR